MNKPSLILEVSTRVWLRELGKGTPLSLADVPEWRIAEWAAQGFDAVWMMGVWLTGDEGRRCALEHPGLREEYSRTLPDWTEADVYGSPYAIRGYDVSPDLGGVDGLRSFREMLARHNLKLILDFIPNHTARDHPWISEHPDWYITGTEADVVADPQRWFWVNSGGSPRAFAHGRDPNFPSWTDTAQLNYHNPDLQAAQRAELLRIAKLCDGVRCDVAMLVLSSIFERVWNRTPEEFWPRAIAEVKQTWPEFFFMAECYWNTEDSLLESGFDAVYDKTLLDDITRGQPLFRDRFALSAAMHRTRVRFLENHDEHRVASQLDPARHRAVAAWTLSLPSIRLLFEGQMEGRRVRIPVQLQRRPDEEVNESVRTFYRALLEALSTPAVRNGYWQLLSPRPAWSGNDSHHKILGQVYETENRTVCIFANMSDARSQCWVHLGMSSPAGTEVFLRDMLGPKSYVRDGIALMLRGLYLDMEPWEAHVFDCTVRPSTGRH